MSKAAAKAIYTLSGGVLTFSKAGSYTIDYLPSGQVKIKLDGGHAAVLSAAEYASVTSFAFAPNAVLNSPLAVNGVAFREAGPGAGPNSAVTFEVTSHNLDNAIGTMITQHGVAWTVDNLLINGSKADTFKAIWDYLDDAYGAGNNYYNIALNETFVRLGVKYVEYLEAGGAPLTDITAKYAADLNNNGVPDRNQSMHDNLLGNLNSGSIDDRNYGEPLETQLRALIPDEYEARPWYGGYDYQKGGAAHDAVRAFDYDKGWSRDDYYDNSYNGLIDPAARDGNAMYYGSGNPVDDWNIVRHEGAQVELGLKVKHRGGDEYPEASIGPDGTATYHVLAGPSPANANRSEWNVDFSATDFSADSDYDFVFEIDVDPTEGVEWMTVYSSAAPLDSDVGDGALLQNSTNLSFYRNFIDIDHGAPGIQPYSLGDGTFAARLSAYDSATGALVAQNQVVIIVGDGNPFG